MTPRRDPDRLIHAFLMEGQTELPDPVYDAVRDHIEQTRQRAVIGSWRTPDMNRYLKIGLAAAAVVVIAVVAFNLLPGSPAPGGEPSASPSVEPSVAPSARPSTTSWTGLPEGAFVVTSAGDPVQVTISIASPGWTWLTEFDAVSKDDDGLDAPETVGVALLAWTWPAGSRFNVYGDPCHWTTTIPETPATTPDEIAAAFAAQALSDASAAVDVTVGGYAGKAVTLHVPMSYHQVPDVGREEEFADCDQHVFAFYGIEGEATEARNAQGPGQIDELWILDVNGSIVILDATYGPAAPAALVEELRALAESATFE
jgi:hypothetical protein